MLEGVVLVLQLLHVLRAAAFEDDTRDEEDEDEEDLDDQRPHVQVVHGRLLATSHHVDAREGEHAARPEGQHGGHDHAGHAVTLEPCQHEGQQECDQD